MANVKVISEWHSQRTDFLDFVELLKRGDRIEFQRAGYCHWAVYIGKCSVKSPSFILKRRGSQWADPVL